MKKIQSQFFFVMFVLAISLTGYLQAANADLTGTITDENTGLPISGALIELIRGNHVEYSTTTDPNGEYSINDIQPGSYDLDASAAGYEAVSVEVKLQNNSTTKVDLSLVPGGGSISGTVTDAVSSSPISGATIQIFQGSTLIAIETTNVSGNYSSPQLAPGTYTLVATATGYRDQAVGAMVEAGNITIVDFSLSTLPGAIAGTVTDAVTTNPIQGATVTAYSGSIAIASADTDASGNYTLPNLAPGEYTLVVLANNYQDQTAGAIVVAGATTTVNFALDPSPGTIAGTVTRSDTGMTLSGATIRIFQQSILIGSTLTDINGAYSFSDLAPGNYIVFVNKTGFQAQFIGAIVSANSTTTVNFVLDPNPGTIAGKVSDANTGNPIRGALVEVLDGPLLIASALTDPNGNYSIPDLQPNTYTVLASASGFQEHFVQATVSSNHTTVVNFSLNNSPGTISGTVIDAVSLNPIEDAVVEVFQGTTRIGVVLTDASGNYTISGLAAGIFTVEADAHGFQGASMTVTVVENATTIVNFALNSNPGTITGIVTDLCSGAAVSEAEVILMGSSFVSFDVTDSSGQYIINDLAPGNYTVTVIKKNYVTTSQATAISEGVTTTLNFAITPIPLPPSGIEGKAFYNKFLNGKERVHCIKWTPSPSGCLSEYQVFRNGSLIHTVPAEGPFEFCDVRGKKKSDTYTVRAVNSFGQVSDFISITLK